MAFDSDRPRRPSSSPARGGKKPGFGSKPAAGRGGPKKDFGDRPKRDFGDRPQRSFSDRPPRGDKPFGERKPRGEFSDRPKRDFGDRPKRDFGDSPRPPRKDFGDRPQRSFGDKPRGDRSFGDRPPRRDFGDSPRPPRSFDDRPKRDFGDRPPRKDFGDRPPRRDFGDSPRPPRKDFGDRPPRRDGGGFGGAPRGDRSFGDRPPRRDFSDSPRPARSYDDRPKRDFGDRPPRGDKPFGDRKPRGDFGDRPARKEYGAKKDYTPRARDGFEKRPTRDSDDAARPEAATKGHEHLFYGVHAVQAALANAARRVKAIFVTDIGEEKIATHLDTARHPEITTMDRRDLERKLPEGAVHQGVAVALEPLNEVFLTDLIHEAHLNPEKLMRVVILDEVTDPHNVGAVLRSMAAFGARAMIVHKRNAPGITGTMAKIATGALEHIPMVAVTNLAQAMEELKEAGFYCVGLDERADFPIGKTPTDRHLALVLGAEGEGLRAKTRSTCDAIATIETFGPIQSLNVSNAAAIALYELTKAATKPVKLKK